MVLDSSVPEYTEIPLFDDADRAPREGGAPRRVKTVDWALLRLLNKGLALLGEPSAPRLMTLPAATSVAPLPCRQSAKEHGRRGVKKESLFEATQLSEPICLDTGSPRPP